MTVKQPEPADQRYLSYVLERLGPWLLHTEACVSENNSLHVGALPCECGLDAAIAALTSEDALPRSSNDQPAQADAEIRSSIALQLATLKRDLKAAGHEEDAQLIGKALAFIEEQSHAG